MLITVCSLIGGRRQVHTEIYEYIWCYHCSKILERVPSFKFHYKRILLQVLHASLKLLRLMLSQLIPGVGLGRAEVTHCLEQTFPNLLARTGDSTTRVRATVSAFIQVLYSQTQHYSSTFRSFVSPCSLPSSFYCVFAK